MIRGPILGIFIKGSYRPPATALYDTEEIKADSTGLKKEEASARIKRADIDNDTYEKAKIAEQIGVGYSGRKWS